MRLSSSGLFFFGFYSANQDFRRKVCDMRQSFFPRRLDLDRAMTRRSRLTNRS
jgi:hypothetical protein